MPKELSSSKKREKWEALQQAITNNDYEKFKKAFIPELHSSLTMGNGSSLLSYSTIKSIGEDIRIFSTLIQYVNVNQQNNDGWTSLMAASDKGLDKLVALLLNHPNINPDLKIVESGGTALFFAAEKGRDLVISMLLKHPRVNPNLGKNGNHTPLHRAAEMGLVSTVQLLLKDPRIDINVTDNEGNTALHLAALDGQDRTVECLLKYNALDVNRTNSQGATALYLAVRFGKNNCIREFLKHPKVDVNRGTPKTPIMIAAIATNSEEIVSMMLNHPNIDPNIPQPDERTTALNHAVTMGSQAMVSLLLKHPRTDPTIATFDGISPLYNAEGNGLKEIAELIERAIKSKGTKSLPPPVPSKKPQDLLPSSGFADQFSGEWKVNQGNTGQIDDQGSFSMERISKGGNYWKQIEGECGKISKFRPSDMFWIHHSGEERMFHGQIEKVELRNQEEIFQPKLNQESSPQMRVSVLNKLEELSGKVKHNRKVKIIRAWHGTNFSIATKIMKTGFANLATLDDGWFGKGIYFTTNPEYAVRYCKDSGDSCLIMVYLILFNPYPVVHDDATAPDNKNLKLLGKSNYKNYGCHYVPVKHYQGADFRPPTDLQHAAFDEIVMFQENHILSKLIVKLERKPQLSTLPPTPTPSGPKQVKDWDVDEVSKWIESLRLSTSYSSLIKSNHINGTALLTMKSRDDWKELGVTVFGDLRILNSESETLIKKSQS